jgi:hypothetical protein
MRYAQQECVKASAVQWLTMAYVVNCLTLASSHVETDLATLGQRLLELL